MSIEMTLPLDTGKIENTIYYWLDLLEKGEYNTAYNLTEHQSYYDWTPALIKEYINGYGLPYKQGETVYKVTDWKKVDNKKRNPINISLFDEAKTCDNKKFKKIGIVHYNLPMNNEQSDLTAIFSILQADNYLTLELTNLCVL